MQEKIDINGASVTVRPFSALARIMRRRLTAATNTEAVAQVAAALGVDNETADMLLFEFLTWSVLIVEIDDAIPVKPGRIGDATGALVEKCLSYAAPEAMPVISACEAVIARMEQPLDPVKAPPELADDLDSDKKKRAGSGKKNSTSS